MPTYIYIYMILLTCITRRTWDTEHLIVFLNNLQIYDLVYLRQLFGKVFDPGAKFDGPKRQNLQTDMQYSPSAYSYHPHGN